MDIDVLLKKSEDAFHVMDWKELAKINKEILEKKTDKRNKDLAAGFYHYALSKMANGPEDAIENLEKSGEAFKSTDETLASFAETERLILLSNLDEANRGRHLRDLGKLAQDLFIKTDNPGHLQLAIGAYESACGFFKKKELEEINKNLTFCYSNYAAKCEDPKEASETYEKLIKLCKGLEKSFKKVKDSQNLARVKMNLSIAYQNLASLQDARDPLKDINAALEFNEEAARIFEKAGAKPEIAKAKQNLANILSDAVQYDVERSEEYLKRVIRLREETKAMFQEAQSELNAAYEDLELGVTYLELASIDGNDGRAKAHLKKAVDSFENAGGVFSTEKKTEDLGQAKMGIAVAYKNQGRFKESISFCNEAIEIFTSTKNDAFLGLTKQNLAATYREMAKTDKKNAMKHITKAGGLEKEAKKLLD